MLADDAVIKNCGPARLQPMQSVIIARRAVLSIATRLRSLSRSSLLERGPRLALHTGRAQTKQASGQPALAAGSASVEVPHPGRRLIWPHTS
jgi:hypothetical protein